jgi:hypothetical protein
MTLPSTQTQVAPSTERSLESQPCVQSYAVADLPAVGSRIIVRPPDRREYRGRLLEIRRDTLGRNLAVVRLDTGWVTTYPVSMVSADPESP